VNVNSRPRSMTSPGRWPRRMDMAVFCTVCAVNTSHLHRRQRRSRRWPALLARHATVLRAALRLLLRWSSCAARRRGAACTLRCGTTSPSSSPQGCCARRGKPSIPRRRSRSGLVALRPRRRSGTPKRCVVRSRGMAIRSSPTLFRPCARSGGRESGVVFFPTPGSEATLNAQRLRLLSRPSGRRFRTGRGRRGR
jgi:hypothetical protein